MAMRRRLLGALAAGLVAARLAFAQPARVASVVVLFAGDSEHDEPAARSFFDEMRRLGWVEGTNITYERLEGRGEREYVEGLARSAASRIPDLIYATSTSTALAVVKETASIPVVFTSASNPVATGLVSSLVRHGGNATGGSGSDDGEVHEFRSGRQDLRQFEKGGNCRGGIYAVVHAYRAPPRGRRGGAAQPARAHWASLGMGRGWRPDDVRRGSRRCAKAQRANSGPDPEGHEAGRHPGRTGDQDRAGRQSAYCQDARRYYSRLGVAPRRPGDRMTAVTPLTSRNSRGFNLPQEQLVEPLPYDAGNAGF